MKVPMFLALLILACSIVIAVDQVYAEPGEPSKNPYPYVDPIREYYDNKQRTANLHPPAPVYYDPFTITIDENPGCGWIPINGRVPYYGIVTVQVFGYVPLEQNPDILYITELTRQNINSNPSHELRGWIEVPCKSELASYLIQVTWGELPYEIKGLTPKHYLNLSMNYLIVVE